MLCKSLVPVQMFAAPFIPDAPCVKEGGKAGKGRGSQRFQRTGHASLSKGCELPRSAGQHPPAATVCPERRTRGFLECVLTGTPSPVRAELFLLSGRPTDEQS